MYSLRPRPIITGKLKKKVETEKLHITFKKNIVVAGFLQKTVILDQIGYLPIFDLQFLHIAAAFL